MSIKLELAPVDVQENIQNYLKDTQNSLISYDFQMAVKKSNSQEDGYLYMVVAKSLHDGTYAVWTCWNSSTNSLNHGHYMLPSLKEVYEILEDNYFE